MTDDIFFCLDCEEYVRGSSDRAYHRDHSFSRVDYEVELLNCLRQIRVQVRESDRGR